MTEEILFAARALAGVGPRAAKAGDENPKVTSAPTSPPIRGHERNFGAVLSRRTCSIPSPRCGRGWG